ncbi:hypothetical protein [Streptomyces sp. NPDC005385]
MASKNRALGSLRLNPSKDSLDVSPPKYQSKSIAASPSPLPNSS